MIKPTEKTDWAIDPTSLKTATDVTRWDFGWSTPLNDPLGKGEKPNLNQQNYWQNAVHKWIEYLKVSKTPLGSIVAVASDLTGAFDSASGVVTDGFQLCDGTAIVGGHSVTGNTPQLTDDRFLMGSSTAGLTGGINTTASHSHGYSHTHGTSSHSHTIPIGSNKLDDYSPSGTDAFYAYSMNGLTTISSSQFATYNPQRQLILKAGTTSMVASFTPNENQGITGNFYALKSLNTSVSTNSQSSTTTTLENSHDNRPQYLSVKYFIKVDV